MYAKGKNPRQANIHPSKVTAWAKVDKCVTVYHPSRMNNMRRGAIGNWGKQVQRITTTKVGRDSRDFGSSGAGTMWSNLDRP